MARRSKELFELLHGGREGADAPAPKETRSEKAPAKAAQAARPGGSAARLLEKAAKKVKSLGSASPVKAGGFGGRKVAVSLNLLLFFIGSFVVTNVFSYVVGRHAGSKKEIPLVTEIRHFVAVQVTAPFESQYSFDGWKLHDQLVEAGFGDAEVLGLDGGRNLQVIAGKFDRDNAEQAEERIEKLKATVARLRRSGRLTDRIPIEIDTVVISYKNRDADSAR